jgi:hypothetical protein
MSGKVSGKKTVWWLGRPQSAEKTNDGKELRLETNQDHFCFSFLSNTALLVSKTAAGTEKGEVCSKNSKCGISVSKVLYFIF